ncbi:hypothetical protein Klosneuvirus_3_10 [Klosneuvirus KNV1]|uniref:Bacteriophage T5 Orf172 DNA-binding domain-containing protein n=1 Tax=Klosneuvirus KNV1 TaxID=1977640 RepID=A0A1V0SJH9_9VIRU|nr:hypothetical protein Klosneuvirus_3_10 [Klosneuvirus KNV1]
MENFLKQFSVLPKKFVDDFFVIAKEHYDDSEKVIDFDIVCKWLEIRKDHLKKVLIGNFEKDYDYIITKKQKKQITGVGLTTYHDIRITPNCFKELCMISSTTKAKDVRKYFIEMERLIKTYYKSITEDMHKQIGLLQTNQKPKLDIKGGIIYVLKAQNSDVTLYKLGKTKNIKDRIKNYNTGNANDVEPIFIMKVNDVNAVENCVKNACKQYQYRKYKEVYQIDIDVLKEVMSKCDDIMKFVAKKNTKQIKKQINDNIKQMETKEGTYFMYIDKQ